MHDTEQGSAISSDTGTSCEPSGGGDYAIFRKGEPNGAANAGWSVHLSRGGRVIQASFYDHTFGSKEAALHVARAYRNAVLEVVPPLTNADMRMLVRKNRTLGTVPGVTFQPSTPSRPASYWIARIDVASDQRVPGYVDDPAASTAKRSRRTITRSFSIKRFGNDAARRMAEEERHRMLTAIVDANEPALRSSRARALHELQTIENRSWSARGAAVTMP